MPKTAGQDEGARAALPSSPPPPEPPRLHTHELHALVDDALGPDVGASLPPPATDETAPGSDAAAAELEVVDEGDELTEAPVEPAPAPRPDPYLGLVIDRRYEIQKLIAQGGMGLVYRCRHSVLGKKLAIKIIRADVAQMPDGYERFLIEAKAASAIGSEHIVDIIDFGALPDGSSYLVMEYLSGVPLSTLMKRHGRMAVPRLAEIGCQIAEGLGAAHAAGIVHRDLKPDNVFVLERKGEDFVKILDFGVARMEQSAKKLTQAGTIVGTPHYMSPEQATGKDVDHRGDIYALGVILYELCAGQVPFDGSHYVAVLHQHLQDEPPPLGSLEPPVVVPEELERIVDKCLAKLPEQRYATMAELARDLAAFCARPSGRTSDLLLPALPLAGAPPTDPAAAAARENAAGAEPASAADLATLVSRGSASALPVPTAALPAPSPTLVLPRPSGRFTLEQKRRVSTIALGVLLVTIVWALWSLSGSDEVEPPAPVVAAPAPSLPAPAAPAAPEPAAPEPRVAPAPMQAAPAPAAPSVPSSAAEASASATGVAGGGATNTDGSSAGAAGAADADPKRADTPEADGVRSGAARRGDARPKATRRGAAPKAAQDKRREAAPSSGSKKARSTEEFMNPWPAPR